MKLVHWSNFAPKRSGLYECAREQIFFERKLGLDSQMAIFETEKPTEDMVDDWIRPISWEEAKDATLFVNHRGLPLEIEKLKKPTVLIIHGTVEGIILEEVFSYAEKTPFNSHINLLKMCDAAVAVNQHDYDIYKLYDPSNKLVMIHDAIDVDRFPIEGYKYPFTHHPQILFSDSLRPNKFPAHIIWAMDEIVKEIPSARLTITGLDLQGILSWRNIILRSPQGHLATNIENIQFLTNDSPQFFRGADILFNSNISGIPSRTELEAKASGCEVVGYSDSFTKWICRPFDVKDIARKVIDCWNEIKDNPNRRQESRQWVLENANMQKQTEEKYIPLYHKVLAEKK